MIEKLYGIAVLLKKIPLIPIVLMKFKHMVFSCSLPYQATIGRNFKLSHGGLGFVINKKTKIGDNCLMGTCVAIGDNVVVGANSVVVKDVPPNCIVAGVPAKIIKESINMHDYI